MPSASVYMDVHSGVTRVGVDIEVCHSVCMYITNDSWIIGDVDKAHLGGVHW